MGQDPEFRRTGWAAFLDSEQTFGWSLYSVEAKASMYVALVSAR
jgi:hypothetical protein